MTDGCYAVKKSSGNVTLWRGKGPLLPRLDIELTERCDNACMHCYINRPARDTQAAARELDTSTWKDILKQAADLGALTVRFTGGEPLLRVDFPELYLYTRKLGIEVVLFTNARRITPELADLFTRIPPRMKIEITSYGMQAESYDSVACSPGAFAEFRRGIGLLLDRQVPFIVKSVMLPPNRSEIDQFEEWATSLPWMEKQPVYSMFLEFRARQDLPAKNHLINTLRLTPEECLAFVSRNEKAFRSEVAKFGASYMRPQGDMLFTCGAGEVGCVDAYGEYQMCMPLRHPDTVYDLKQGTLREALTHFFPMQRELRASNPAYIARCARCFLKGFCGQCPGKSWSEHGTLDTPVEYLCEIAHIQARYLGMLAETEYAWEISDWQERVNRLSITGTQQEKSI